MEKERVITMDQVQDDLSEFEYGVDIQEVKLFTVKTFFDSIIFLVCTGIFLVFDFGLGNNRTYTTSRVKLSDENVQEVMAWKARIAQQDMFRDNVFIKGAFIVLIFFLIILGYNLIHYFVLYFCDKLKVSGISNRLATFSYNRFRFSKSGKLLVYKDDKGCTRKSLIVHDLVFAGVFVSLFVMFLTVGFLIEVM